jgi:hypothetical protein
MRLRWMACAAAVGGWTLLAGSAAAQSGKEDLRKELKDLELGGSWIYDDLEAGFAQARTAGKPLIVVFR